VPERGVAVCPADVAAAVEFDRGYGTELGDAADGALDPVITLPVDRGPPVPAAEGTVTAPDEELAVSDGYEETVSVIDVGGPLVPFPEAGEAEAS
jgi:hypothetical protein